MKRILRKNFIKSLPVVLLFSIVLALGLSCQKTQNHDADSTEATVLNTGNPNGICAYCGNERKNTRFGAAIQKPGEEELLFSTIECMAAYIADQPESMRPESSEIKVANYGSGTSWLSLEEARILKTELLENPRGLNLLAYAAEDGLDHNLRVAYGGRVIDWDEVAGYVEQNRDQLTN